MIYSKTINNQTINGIFHNLPIPIDFFRPLSECTFQDGDVYYYDRHDLAIRLLKFKDFIEEQHWSHLKNNPTVKLLLNYSDDYFNAVNIKWISKGLLERQIDPKQVYFITMDQNFTNFAIEEFERWNLKGVHVTHYNTLLGKTDASYVSEALPTYKFSVLSRNYYSWRLSLFLYLVENNLIDDFVYSFHNYLPYTGGGLNVPLEEIKQDVLKEGYKLTPKLLNWVEKIPYDLGNRNAKWANFLSDVISSSDFHLLIESHFDTFLWDNFRPFTNAYNHKNFAPAFLTEKTWKTVFSKRPFIIAATPYSLEGFRALGFKSFSPFIDETYDTIEDNEARKQALLAEVKRICTLPTEEYRKVVEGCRSICEYNYSLLKEHHSSIGFNEDFKFFLEIK